MATKVRVALKKLYHSKKNGRPRINIFCASNPEKTQQFVRNLQEALTKESPIDDTIDSKWSHLRDAVYNAAITAYGKKERKSADWYEAHWEEMEPVTEVRKKAPLAYKVSPCLSTLEALRATRKNAQQTSRHCASTYWLNLCSSLQTAADT